MAHLFVNYKFQPYPDKPDWELLYKPEQKRSFNIWLSRQDQLEDMIPDDCEVEIFRDAFNPDKECWYVLIGDNKYQTPLFFGQTLEQALIQAIMHELHKKKWVGGKWVNI